jgi:hypothetical protein
MPVIGMNTQCYITPKIGNDAFGQPKLGIKRESKCAVLKLETMKQATTLRPDSGGSRGHADEEVADLHVLVNKNESITIDDIFEVHGVTFHIVSNRPRFDAFGKFDHIELMGKIA